MIAQQNIHCIGNETRLVDCQSLYSCGVQYATAGVRCHIRTGI